MRIPRDVAWSTGARCAPRAANVLRELGADFDADTPAASLSIAQKHVVQIARALVDESRVLILDEPTASLSQRECAELFRIARKLRDAGCALLFISHKFDEIFELADRYAVFRDGASVGAGLLARHRSRRADPAHGGPPGRAAVSEARGRGIGEELLRVENLGRGRASSKTISFALRRGEILGIYGLVGAGRTELAQVLFGVERADRGTRAAAAADHRAGARGSAEPGQHPAVLDRREHRAAESRRAGAARLDARAPRARAGASLDRRAGDQGAGAGADRAAISPAATSRRW